LGVSRQGEFKNTIKTFLQKVHVEKKSKISTKNSMSVFPRLFCYRVFGCVSAMGVRKHYKKRSTKKIVSKFVYKQFDQKSKTDFFSILFYHVFGRFSMRGVQKHDKTNIEKINLTLVLFRTLTHPPTTGVTDFFFAGLLHLPEPRWPRWRRGLGVPWALKKNKTASDKRRILLPYTNTKGQGPRGA
jgi:hypothetical protein